METLNAQIARAREANYTDAEILQYLSQGKMVDQARVDRALGSGYDPREVLDFLATSQPRTVTDNVKNSFAGGIVRGARDIVDGGAQLLTRGLETVAPAGSAFENWARGQRENVEAVNKEAERDYQQNWRRGSVADRFDGGRLAGNVAGGVAAAAALAPAAAGAGATTASAMLRGMGQGVAGSAVMPVENPGDDYWKQKGVQTAIGAGAGAVGGYLAPKIATALQGRDRVTAQVSGGGSRLGEVGPDPTSTLTDAQTRLLARGRELGFRNTPGQTTGSRALQQMEARMESSPFFSGPFNTIKANNQQVLNQQAARSIGETANALDSAVLGRADGRLGEVFDAVANGIKGAKLPADQLVPKLASIEQGFDGLLPKPLLDFGLVNRFVDLVGRGEASGAQLRSLSSQLGRAGKNAMTGAGGDREVGAAYFAVKDLVDDVIADNLDPALRASYDAARQQYRNLMLLTTRQNVVNPASGNVSGPNLAAALQAKDRGGYLFGRNTSDMYDAARFSQAFKPIVGDSGTATRSMEISPISALLSIPSRMAAGAYTSRPVVNTLAAAQRGVAPNAAGDELAGAVRKLLPAASGSGMLGLLASQSLNERRR
jgi:hypothetical protein